MVLNSKFKIPSGRELFKSLKNAQLEWESKNPLQKWCYFYSIGKLPFAIIRFPLLNDVHHVHWFAYFPFVYATVSISLMVYTLLYYAVHGELQMGLPSTCIASVCMGHFPIVITIVFKDRLKLQSLIDFGGRYIYHDSHEKTEHNRICSDHMDITMRQFIIKTGVILTSLVSTVIGPLNAYVVHGIRTTTIEARIPFTEPKSDAEFAWNFFIQTAIAMHAFPIYLGLETFLSILENVVTISPRLVESDLVRTIRLYEEKAISELELRQMIGNIVKQSIDADNYVDSLSDLFYWRNLFTPVTFTYSIGIAIFSQFTMGYAAGYGMMGMSWVQLFYVCEVGENIQDNGFAGMLYAVKWDVLPLNVQKVIMLLINRKQNERGLSLGPFGMGINRESFKLWSNKIYTFVMFLLKFFK